MVERRKKRIFTGPAMLIGMGIGFLLALKIPTALLACMFIGIGVGSLLDSILFIREEKKSESS